MKKQLVTAIAALSMAQMVSATQTSTVGLVDYKPHVNPYPHQSSRQRARYARQVKKGQIRNAVCAWWCYPAMGDA